MENKEEMTLNELEHIIGGRTPKNLMTVECPICHHQFKVDLDLNVAYCPRGHKMELNG